MNWIILVTKLKEINRDYKSNGEWNYKKLKKFIDNYKKTKKGYSPVIIIFEFYNSNTNNIVWI